MAASTEIIPIEYGVYSAADADAMARLLGEVFSRRDPPAVAAGLTASEFEAFVRLFCPKAGAEGLTIVARLAGTGVLVGALLTEDSASALPDGMDRLSPKFDPIFDILGQLDAEYRGDRAVRPGDSLHLFLLGVADRVAGRGVAQQLVAACLEHGARRGYQLASHGSHEQGIAAHLPQTGVRGARAAVLPGASFRRPRRVCGHRRAWRPHAHGPIADAVIMLAQGGPPSLQTDVRSGGASVVMKRPPNTRMQRTRSSPSALRSPLMRCPLGRGRTWQLIRRVTLTLIAAGTMACTAALPLLPHEDRVVLTALLEQEARHPERPRPILVLDSTDPEIPPDFWPASAGDNLPELPSPAGEVPAELLKDLWARQGVPAVSASRKHSEL